MTGIWSESDGRWRALSPVGFAQEEELHDLIERSPDMLPLAGSPPLVVLGREVRCGSGYADLIGVEADTGTPVVIEIKLASNTDRREVLTQVLGYAAYLRRLDATGFEALVSAHLVKAHAASVQAAVSAAVELPDFDGSAFAAGLKAALDEGRLRCVIVIDTAPRDLVELVGYLQDVSNDRLNLDLVTVKAYEVGGRRVLVPQLVEPDRTPEPQLARATASGPTVTAGAQAFEDSIPQAATDQRDMLERLHAWALQLEHDGLATLYTAAGKGRWVLRVEIPGQPRGLVTVRNDNGASISPYRTVFEQEAPRTLQLLDERFPSQIKQGNYFRADDYDEVLNLLRAAYIEAARGGAQAR
ncbi:MAG: hypothetical protein ACRDQ7_02380 [Haloechinothrix sp.]